MCLIKKNWDGILLPQPPMPPVPPVPSSARMWHSDAARARWALLPLSSPSQESFEEKEKGWRVTKFHFQAAQKTRCEQTAPGRRDPAICCCGRRRGRRRARRGQAAPATPQKVSLGTSGEREAPATPREGNVSPDRRPWQPLCR